MKKNQQHSQPIIGNGALRKLEKMLNSVAFREAKIYILTDTNTLNYCLPLFEAEVVRSREAEIIEIPAGEESKDLELCKGVWLSLLELGASRDAVLINLGGGTVTDIGGFAASTFMRGIRFFNVPTTLMGMADAGMGGKTGLDLEGYKNMIGTFAIPEGVYIYPAFLNTLPAKEMRSGYAEIIKYALIADETLWKSLIRKNYTEITQWTALLNKSADIKMSVVQLDPEETGLRKVLNFGHTIGHALETRSMLKDKKPLSHGEAVAIGIICESFLSYKLLGLPEPLLGEICDVVLESFPWKALPAKHTEILPLLKADKKNENGELCFTLIAGFGQVMINQACPESYIIESLEYYMGLKP